MFCDQKYSCHDLLTQSQFQCYGLDKYVTNMRQIYDSSRPSANFSGGSCGLWWVWWTALLVGLVDFGGFGGRLSWWFWWAALLVGLVDFGGSGEQLCWWVAGGRKPHAWERVGLPIRPPMTISYLDRKFFIPPDFCHELCLEEIPLVSV